jgi:MoaA/NifB/PqqE/SkfB family radical SAM enzyme
VQLWAELGQECQLECVHCYAASGPGKGFGTMTADDWERVIRQAAEVGTRHITFIGGEPTLHPALGRLVRLAVASGLQAEIFSNLVHMSPATWELCETPGVSLATSWYTNDRMEHKQITGRDTWRQTLAGIKEAVRRDIPIRVGMIGGVLPGQHAAEGEELLRARGVTRIGTDHLREFGRGTVQDPSQACGNCGHGRAAVLPDGTVTPCPMTRWMNAGDVRDGGLGTILESVMAMALTLPARGCDPTVKITEACKPTCVPDSYCNPLCTPGACKPRV